MIRINYIPTPKQQMFHATNADEVLFGGAAGGGKSKGIVMDALLRCLKYPRTTAYIFRRTYRELEDTIIKEARASYPPEIARYVANEHAIKLPNGSEIRFAHCEHIQDAYSYRGAEIQWLYFDELTTFEEETYDFINTRKRAKKELGVVPIVRSASNPGGIGHGWVKKRFVDAGPYMSIIEQELKSETLGRTKIVRTQYIPSLAKENPYIGEDYIFELERKPEALKKALLYGNWDAFEGQVFTEFVNDERHYIDRRNSHVIAPFDIPIGWAHYMSFDHGYSRPFSVGWWAVDPEGRAYRYREWYGCEAKRANVGIKLSPRQIAEGIIKREEEYEAKENINVQRIADPAIFERSRGDSVAQQMEPIGGRAGVFFTPGDNARIAGKMQMHERLRFGEDGKPMMYIFSTCRDFIRTVPNLPYDPSNSEDIDTDAEDHAYDEARYFLMARPAPVRAVTFGKPVVYDPFKEAKK